MTTLKTYLQNVQARLENATPGKWLRGYPNAGQITPMEGHVWSENKELVAKELTSSDSELIANCPTDLSTLLQIVKIQSQALEKYSESAFEIEGKIYKIGSVADQAIQQVETLVSGGKNDCV